MYRELPALRDKRAKWRALRGQHIDRRDRFEGQVAESLADLIVASAEEPARANLIAHTLQHLGAYLLLKSGAMQAEH